MLLTLGIVTVFALVYSQPSVLSGALFSGSTVQKGLEAAKSIGGISGTSVGGVIDTILAVIIPLVTTIAVFTVVIAGMYMILSNGEEAQKDKAKKIIQYTLIGIGIVILSPHIVELALNVFSGNAGGSAAIVSGIAISVMSAVISIATTVALLMIVIAGLYLILSNGDEGQKDKAKKIIIYALVGIIIILMSRTIVIFVNELFG